MSLSNTAEWHNDLPPLLDEHIRSYADPDTNANRRQAGIVRLTEDADIGPDGVLEEVDMEARVEHNRRPACESRRVISWIWRTSKMRTLDSSEMDESKHHSPLTMPINL